MKIEFGALVKASIDSLNTKIKPVSKKYSLVVRGSQVLLRARLQRYPAEAGKINEMLNIKDLDVQLEPVSDEIDNREAFQEATELMQATLSKGKTQDKEEQPEAPASVHYAHLHTTGVKKAKENMLDASVQRNKIEACMNIDQKVDASGKMLFLNTQHQHDFEVTYLKDNLIIFYHMDTMNLNEYPAQNSMAFRLKKCLSPEVQNFETLLDEPTAHYVEKLFEDPKLADIKSKIMRMLQKHYKRDPVQAERQIRDLYQKSIQHSRDVAENEIDKLAKTVTQQHKVISEMITYIEANMDKQYAFRQKLSGMLASSSSPTLKQVETQLKALNTLKIEVMTVYEVVELKKLKEEPPIKREPRKITTLLPLSPTVNDQRAIDQPKLNPKKKAKTKPVADTKQQEPEEDFEAILKDAKNKYPKLSLLERYIILANKHRQSLTLLAVSSQVADHQAFKEKSALLNFSLMLELINAAKKDKALEQAFFEFKDLYLDAITTMKNDAKLNEASDDAQCTGIFEEVDKLKSVFKSGDTYLKSIHEFMISAYLGPEPTMAPTQLKKAVACVKNHRERKAATCDLLIRSLVNIVIDKKPDMGDFILLLMDAVSVDLKDVMKNGLNGSKMINHVQSLLALYCRGSIYPNPENNDVMIEMVFFGTLVKEVIAHKEMKDTFLESFTSIFINKIIGSLVMGNGAALEAHHFKIMLAHAGTQIVKRIFPSNDISRNHFLVAKVLTSFSSLIPKLRTYHRILIISTPAISKDFKDQFLLNTPDKCLLPTDKESSPDDVFRMLQETVVAVKSAKKNLERTTFNSALKYYDLTIFCIWLMFDMTKILFNKEFKNTYTEALRSSTAFMRMAKDVSDNRENMSAKSELDEDVVINAIANHITIVSDAILTIDEANPHPETADAVINQHDLKMQIIDLDAKINHISKVIDAAKQTKHPQVAEQKLCSVHESANQLLLSLIVDDIKKEKLCKRYVKYFIETSILNLMSSSSHAMCSSSARAAIDHVLDSVFISPEYKHIDSLREAVVLHIRPISHNMVFMILMLCIPMRSPTTNIPFVCNAPVPSGMTPADAFRFGVDDHDKETIADLLTSILKDISDIQNEYSQEKINNHNLDVAYIAIEILHKNMNLLYEKNFNVNFHKLLCTNDKYIAIWEVISSLHVIAQVNSMGGTHKAIVEAYQNKVNKMSAQSETTVDENYKNTCKL